MMNDHPLFDLNTFFMQAAHKRHTQSKETTTKQFNTVQQKAKKEKKRHHPRKFDANLKVVKIMFLSLRQD